jgi:hypothetical protein
MCRFHFASNVLFRYGWELYSISFYFASSGQLSRETMKVNDASKLLLAVVYCNVQRALAVIGNHGIGRTVRYKEMRGTDNQVRFRMMVKEDKHHHDRIFVSKHDNNNIIVTNIANDKELTRTRKELSQDHPMMQGIQLPYFVAAYKSTSSKDDGSRKLQSDACSSDLSTMNSCVNTNYGCDITCITEALEDIFAPQDGDTMDCSYFSSGFCPRVSSCGCETCKDEITGYLSCIASCTIQCDDENSDSSYSSTTSPTEDYCPDEYEAARDCTLYMDSCAGCVDYAYNSIFGPNNTTTCSSFVNGICPAITTNCDCGDCRQAIQDVSFTFLF